MAKQITNSIVMVRPIAFCFNTQTAANDFFQDDRGEKKDIVEAKALIEFDGSRLGDAPDGGRHQRVLDDAGQGAPDQRGHA